MKRWQLGSAYAAEQHLDALIAEYMSDAERALRPAVITRKVGGCNRTPEGAHAHAVLASIGATCRQRGIPVLDFLVRLQRVA